MSYQDNGSYRSDRFDNHVPKKNYDNDREEVYTNRVLAGKRTYFFDVKATRSGEDFFITITESKRVGEGRYEKHKVFLYKEDFGKFVTALHDVVGYIQNECLPEYDFRGLPELTFVEEEHEAYDEEV